MYTDGEAPERKGCCGMKPKTSRLVKWLCPAFCFIVAAVTCTFFLDVAFKMGTKMKLVVTSKDDSGYNAWLTYEGGKSPMFIDYYLFNLTNALDVLHHGAVPEYKELGPYTYQMDRSRENVAFSDDGAEVTYSPRITYHFLADKSTGSEDDIIWNVNPAYLAAINVAGNAPRMQLGTGAGYFRKHIEFFESTLLPDVESQTAAPMIGTKHTALVAKYKAAGFAEAWANDMASAAPGGADEWKGMLVAQVTGHKSNIPAAAVDRLFSSTSKCNLLDAGWNCTQAWSHNTAANVAMLAKGFGITADQVKDVMKWRAAFLTTFDLQSVVFTKFDVTTAQEFGVLQWSTAKPTNAVSCQQLYPGMFPAMKPELYFANANTGMTQEVLNNLLYGPVGVLVNPSNWAKIDILFQHFNFPEIKKIWGITETEFFAIFEMATDTVTALGEPFLVKLYNENMGLITHKSANGWLFEDRDPLLDLLWPAASHNGHFFTNNSKANDDEFPSTVFTYTAYTGKSDNSKINWIFKKNGMTHTPATFWNGTEPISGTDASQFGLDIHRGEELHIWEDDLSRRLQMVPPSTRAQTKDVADTDTLLDLPLFNYVVDPDTMSPNEHYFQTIDGFWNITGARKNSPIYVCNPHFYGANETWRTRMKGITPPVEGEHQTVIGVYGPTGTTLKAHKRTQVNLYLSADHQKQWFPTGDPNCLPEVCTTEMAGGYMYPLVWFDNHAEASESAVSLIKLVIALKVALPIVFGIVAAFLLLMGVLCTTIWWENEKICCCRVRPEGASAKKLGDVGSGYHRMGDEA